MAYFSDLLLDTQCLTLVLVPTPDVTYLDLPGGAYPQISSAALKALSVRQDVPGETMPRPPNTHIPVSRV